MKTFVFATLACLYAVMYLCLDAVAQTLQPVSAPTDWTAIGIIVAMVLIVAAGVWYARNNPGAAAKAKAEAEVLRADLASVAAKAVAALHNLTETHAEVVAKIPVPGAVEVTPAEPVAAPVETKTLTSETVVPGGKVQVYFVADPPA